MINDQINHPAIKGSSVVGAWLVGMTWGERASMVAFFYTVLLIIDWFWKRFVKPLLIRRGVIKGKPLDFMDTTGNAPLDDKA